MGYKDALKAAGARVLLFEQFGSYQGDCYAKVEYNGKSGWINGSYGSCSGCDAFEADFGWDEPTPETLAEFGKQYLDLIMTQEEAEAHATKNGLWDIEAATMVKFLKDNA